MARLPPPNPIGRNNAPPGYPDNPLQEILQGRQLFSPPPTMRPRVVRNYERDNVRMEVIELCMRILEINFDQSRTISDMESELADRES